jgi:hypothetical protein
VCPELVAEGAVGADGFAAGAGGELGDEVPVGLFAGGGEEGLEGGAGGAFVGDFVRGVGGELFVVALDFLVRGFEVVGEGHDQVDGQKSAAIEGGPHPRPLPEGEGEERESVPMRG